MQQVLSPRTTVVNGVRIISELMRYVTTTEKTTAKRDVHSYHSALKGSMEGQDCSFWSLA
jgi:hypothetical protein